MQRGLLDHSVTLTAPGGDLRAQPPAPLPPDPPIDWSPGLRLRFDEALLALGRLDAVAALRPEASRFLGLFLRREAVLSAQIAGLRPSLVDLLRFEAGQAPAAPQEEVREVAGHVAAWHHGRQLLAQGLPLSLRLFRELHGVLFAGGGGRDASPGEFRRGPASDALPQTGGLSVYAPPASAVLECLGHLRAFLHDQPAPVPPLVKAGLALAQFEAIAPFAAGNGRLARLLVALLLQAAGILREPLLALSLHFQAQSTRYRDLLGQVRLTGDWEAWLDFFAEAVIVGAADALEVAQQALRMASLHHQAIAGLGRAAASAERVHRILLGSPLATSNLLVHRSGLTPATVNKALWHLERLGLVRELTAQKRNRIFGCTECLEIMGRGTQPAGT